jgi:hypothetical protein
VNDQARAAVRRWQESVNAAYTQSAAANPSPAAPAQAPSVDRGLTPEEIDIARSVFGGALTTRNIRVTDDSPLPPNAVAFPNHIRFPPGALDGPMDLHRKAWLVHELTHIWQYQQGHTVPELALDAAKRDYDYGGEQALRKAIIDGKRLGDFNFEEQGDILRDYYYARERGQDTSAYQPFVDQVRFGTAEGPPYPQPAPPLGPAI